MAEAASNWLPPAQKPSGPTGVTATVNAARAAVPVPVVVKLAVAAPEVAPKAQLLTMLTV